jgi:glucose 1-dehydrogenase
MPNLTGKNVLITGASSGIGAATAILFGQDGANVAINYYQDQQEAEAVRAKVEKAGPTGKHLIIKADVSHEDDVKRMFSAAISELGGLDVLVNNSGIQAACPSDQLEMDEFDRILAVNIRGAFMCAREALRHFLSRGAPGVILFNSSVHEIIPKPTYVSYSISKGGMENLTRTLALEYASRGIRVNAVGPGAIVTPINDAWIHDPKKRAEVASHIPMGRAGNPEEIASVFAFLASDEASYITGQTIFACGGLTLYPEFRTSWSS